MYITQNLLCSGVGGTWTDVSCEAGRYEHVPEFNTAGNQSNQSHIATVARALRLTSSTGPEKYCSDCGVPRQLCLQGPMLLLQCHNPSVAVSIAVILSHNSLVLQLPTGSV